MAKLNQIIAVEKGVKSKSLQDITAAHHRVQKPALLAGISRTYQPKDEEGEQLPPESTRVQVQGEDVLREMAASLTRLFDVTATKDWANCAARADVTVDGRTVVADVPVSFAFTHPTWPQAAHDLARRRRDGGEDVGVTPRTRTT